MFMQCAGSRLLIEIIARGPMFMILQQVDPCSCRFLGASIFKEIPGAAQAQGDFSDPQTSRPIDDDGKLATSYGFPLPE